VNFIFWPQVFISRSFPGGPCYAKTRHEVVRMEMIAAVYLRMKEARPDSKKKTGHIHETKLTLLAGRANSSGYLGRALPAQAADSSMPEEEDAEALRPKRRDDGRHRCQTDLTGAGRINAHG
jgi:hypothetical protein